MALPQQRFPISRMRWALKLTTGEWDEESPSAPEVEKFWAALKMFLLAFPMACTCFRSSVGGNKDAGVRQKEKGFEEILAANLTIAERIVFFSIKLIIYVKLKGIKTLFPVNVEKGGVQILYLFSCGWFNANQQTANSQPQKLEKLVSEVVWLNVCVCVCFYYQQRSLAGQGGPAGTWTACGLRSSHTEHPKDWSLSAPPAGPAENYSQQVSLPWRSCVQNSVWFSKVTSAPLYLIAGGRACSKRKHSTATFLEAVSQQTGQIRWDTNILRFLFFQMSKDQLQQCNPVGHKHAIYILVHTLAVKFMYFFYFNLKFTPNNFYQFANITLTGRTINYPFTRWQQLALETKNKWKTQSC